MEEKIEVRLMAEERSARVLPNARLLTVKEDGHFPWVEEPETVFGAIDTFPSGQCPAPPREVVSMDDD